MPAKKAAKKTTKKPAGKARKTVKKISKKETIKVKGEHLIKTVKNLINEGNVRRITIKDKNGKQIIIIPLTIGVIGTVFAPVLAAVGAIAALVTECSITVERK